MANGHCWVPLCNNDKRYDSGKDLSDFNFSRDKKKGKHVPSLEYTQVHWLRPSSLVSNPKWWLRDVWVLLCVVLLFKVMKAVVYPKC